MDSPIEQQYVSAVEATRAGILGADSIVYLALHTKDKDIAKTYF